MKFGLLTTVGAVVVAAVVWMAAQPRQIETVNAKQNPSANAGQNSTGEPLRVDDAIVSFSFEEPMVQRENIQLVGYQSCGQCDNPQCTGCAHQPSQPPQYGGPSQYGGPQFSIPQDHQAPGNIKCLEGVDANRCLPNGKEPGWKDSTKIPWEMFAYGEYIGPHRTPHVPDYRIRVNDQLEFNYMLTREQSSSPYQFQVGDQLALSSAIDETLDQGQTEDNRIEVISDGMISLKLVGQVRAAGKTVQELQRELNERYLKFVKNPSIVVQPVKTNTRLQDLRDAVDARAGNGGQIQLVVVSPDGTIQLPRVGSVPAVGLTLDEIRREVNARYQMHIRGIDVTPKLVQRAPRFIYVVGQVNRPGRIELTAPTTTLGAIALAEGELAGANLRNVVVFRRDAQWRLVATRLDLSGAMLGRRPAPSDDIWLRDSDIVLLPKRPIIRISEAVDQYLTQTVYSIVPQFVVFDFDNLGAIGN